MDDKYYLAAERAVAAARDKASTYLGPCSACKWYRSGGIFGGSFATCANPVVKVAAFSVNGAYEADRLQRCTYQRDDDGIWGPVVCGPSGRLFEPKGSFLGRFFGE